MIDAITYSDVVNAVNKEQRQITGRKVCFDSVDPATEHAMAEINSKLKRHSLVAVLFCNPNTGFCRDEILSSLNYLHHRSKHYINIFCCGYGAYWPTHKYPDLQPVTSIDGAEWSYSDKAFVTAIEEFESRTKWKYSGENELLILDVSPSKKECELEINNAIVCNLEKMKQDKAFTSVRAYMESIVRYASGDSAANAWEYSDLKGIEIGKNLLKDAILSLIPNQLQESYRRAENFVVKQI